MKIMQERPQYKITPEQGWSHMETLLDKSLPVAYRSRRFLVFWWATTVAVISLLAIVFLSKERTHIPNPQPAVTSPTGIASNDTRPSTNENTITEAASENNHVNNTNKAVTNISTNNNPGKDKNINPASITKRPTHKPAESKPMAETPQPSMNNVAKTNNITSSETIHISNPDRKALPAVINDIEISNATGNVSDEDQANGDILSGTSEAGTVRPNYPSLNFLPPADVDYASSDNNIDLIQPGNLSFSTKRHLFTPEISIGAMAGSQNGVGLNGGAGVDYALNSRLSLTVSAGLSTYNPGALSGRKDESLDADPITRTDNNYAETYIIAEKVNTSTDYNAINPFVKSIRQWEFSAGMKYALAKRFFIEGGLTLGLGTTAKSEYPIVSFLLELPILGCHRMLQMFLIHIISFVQT